MLRKIFGRPSEGRSEAQVHKARWRGDYRANAPIHSIRSALIILGKWAGMQAASFCRHRRLRARSDGADKPIAE